MDAALRDVVVLGWWAGSQRRITFIRLLDAELGLGIGDAKQILDDHLRGGAPIVIPIAPAARAREVAVAIEAMGAEVCVLSGHLGAADGTCASAEFAAIQTALHEFHKRTFSDPATRARAAREICRPLRVRRVVGEPG